MPVENKANQANSSSSSFEFEKIKQEQTKNIESITKMSFKERLLRKNDSSSKESERTPAIVNSSPSNSSHKSSDKENEQNTEKEEKIIPSFLPKNLNLNRYANKQD